MIYDVLVIGCGPVGALAGNLLGRAGLSTAVVEQEAEPHPLPRAVHLDHEAMRLLQSDGRYSTLGRAGAAYGRIAKSLFLLAYLDDQSYRRRVLQQIEEARAER